MRISTPWYTKFKILGLCSWQLQEYSLTWWKLSQKVPVKCHFYLHNQKREKKGNPQPPVNHKTLQVKCVFRAQTHALCNHIGKTESILWSTFCSQEFPVMELKQHFQSPWQKNSELQWGKILSYFSSCPIFTWQKCPFSTASAMAVPSAFKDGKLNLWLISAGMHSGFWGLFLYFALFSDRLLIGF